MTSELGPCRRVILSCFRAHAVVCTGSLSAAVMQPIVGRCTPTKSNIMLVIPKYTSMRYYCRSINATRLEELMDKIIPCFK
jgi:hypothetical protein